MRLDNISNELQFGQAQFSHCLWRAVAFSQSGTAAIKTSCTFVQILDFCGITTRSGMPPALKMLIHKFQHVALPDLCPKWLVVTAPEGSYLPGYAKTRRKPVYPFHPSCAHCGRLLSCGFQQISYLGYICTGIYSYSRLCDMIYVLCGSSSSNFLKLRLVLCSLIKSKPQTV